MWTCCCQIKEDLWLVIDSRSGANVIFQVLVTVGWEYSDLTALLLNQLFFWSFCYSEDNIFFPVRFRYNCFVLSVFLSLMSQVFVFVLEIYLIVLAWKLWFFFFKQKTPSGFLCEILVLIGLLWNTYCYLFRTKSWPLKFNYSCDSIWLKMNV